MACVDAPRFILGTAITRHLGIGIIPIRNAGKLPLANEGEEFRDYSGETERLGIRTGILPPRARVPLIGEWIETGARIAAAAKLIEAQGRTIVGIASVDMDQNDDTAAIGKKHSVHTASAGR